METNFRGPVRFGVFEFDPLSGDLRKHGLSVRLSPHATTLLRILLEPPLRMHTRDELQKRIWPGQVFLDFEHGLNKIVHSLREALDDTGTNARLIETTAGRGYQFIPSWIRSDPPRAGMLSGQYSNAVAVLPIQVAGSASGPLYLGSLLTAEITDALTAISGLRVLANATVRSHTELGIDPQCAGQSLGVLAVLTGEAVFIGAELFLRMELIDVSDGAQLSVARFDGPMDDRPLAEKKIGEEILRQLRPALLAFTETTIGVAGD